MKLKKNSISKINYNKTNRNKKGETKSKKNKGWSANLEDEVWIFMRRGKRKETELEVRWSYEHIKWGRGHQEELNDMAAQ